MLRLLLALVSLLASDTFNRANANPIGSPWTTVTAEGAMQIVSNKATFAADADSAVRHSTLGSYPNDQFSRAKLATSGTAGGAAGPALHVRIASAAQTYYRLEVDHAASNNVNVHKVVAGVFSVVSGFPLTQAWTDGDTWELRAVGTLISVYRNGSLVQSGTDASSPITSGAFGFGYSSSDGASTIDDWEGGDFAGGAPISNPLPRGRFMKTKPQFDTTIPAVVTPGGAFRRTLHPFGAGKGKRTKGR